MASCACIAVAVSVIERAASRPTALHQERGACSGSFPSAWPTGCRAAGCVGGVPLLTVVDRPDVGIDAEDDDGAHANRRWPRGEAMTSVGEIPML